MPDPGSIIRDHLGQEFCLVEAGTFVGGVCSNETLCVEAPFLMGRHPVTVALWTAFLRDSHYNYPEVEQEALRRVSPLPDCPAVNISWLDAKEFCRWLRRRTGEYYSLPQMVEWEKAARGTDGRLYPWGRQPPTPEHAFYGAASGGITSQVGKRPKGASPTGCHDMLGNVWEWTVDCFDDPNDAHVLMGGSWQNHPEELQCGIRLFSHPPFKRRPYMGLRLLYLPGAMYESYVQAYSAGS